MVLYIAKVELYTIARYIENGKKYDKNLLD
jgi:hypothetical protein